MDISYNTVDRTTFRPEGHATLHRPIPPLLHSYNGRQGNYP